MTTQWRTMPYRNAVTASRTWCSTTAHIGTSTSPAALVFAFALAYGTRRAFIELPWTIGVFLNTRKEKIGCVLTALDFWKRPRIWACGWDEKSPKQFWSRPRIHTSTFWGIWSSGVSGSAWTSKVSSTTWEITGLLVLYCLVSYGGWPLVLLVFLFSFLFLFFSFLFLFVLVFLVFFSFLLLLFFCFFLFFFFIFEKFENVWRLWNQEGAAESIAAVSKGPNPSLMPREKLAEKLVEKEKPFECRKGCSKSQMLTNHYSKWPLTKLCQAARVGSRGGAFRRKAAWKLGLCVHSPGSEANIGFWRSQGLFRIFHIGFPSRHFQAHKNNPALEPKPSTPENFTELRSEAVAAVGEPESAAVAAETSTLHRWTVPTWAPLWPRRCNIQRKDVFRKVAWLAPWRDW